MRTPTSGPILIALVAVFAGAVMFATTSVTVVEGDTLHAIGVRHGVSTADLVAWNEIDDPDRIYVGDVILLAAPAEPGTPQPVHHIVSAGDTLTVIAARYGASVASIAAANGLSDVDFIRVGQRLTVGDTPEPATEPDPEPASDPAATAVVAHTIAPGDTLFSIARRYERTVSAIAAANGITDTERIRSGEVLVIPAAETEEGREAAPTDGPERETDGGADGPDDDTASDTTAPDGGEAEASTTEADQTDPPAPEPTDPPEDDAPADAPARGAAPDPSASAAGLADAFELWSISYGVDQALLEAIAWYATDWNPTTVGIDGRVGIAQMTPAQIELVETALLGRDLDPFDGPDGVRLAARYLRYVQDRTHSEEEALMAFRQGLDSLIDAGATADAEAFALAVQDIRDQRA